MLWDGWLTLVALGMGVTLTEAGVILALLFTISLIVVVAIATRGREARVVIPITGMLGIIFFTFVGWFPMFLGSVIALIVSLWVALAGSGRL